MIRLWLHNTLLSHSKQYGILHENLHELHIKERNWAIFKIDFAKMYDKIKMEFCLQQALRIEGFDLVWCEWVKAFVQGGNMSPVRWSESWLKYTVLTELLWEKNTVLAEKKQAEQAEYRISQTGLFGLSYIRLVFSAKTVFFSYNNSVRTVFFSQDSDQQTGPKGKQAVGPILTYQKRA